MSKHEAFSCIRKTFYLLLNKENAEIFAESLTQNLKSQVSLFMLKYLHFSKEINLIFLSIFLFSCAIGMNLVTFPTILNLNNISSFKVGFAFAFEMCFSILASFFLSKIIHKLGVLRSLKFSSICYGSCIFLIYFYQNFFLWLAFVSLTGFCWFVYVITRQSWLNILLSNSQRGIATGVFSLSVSGGIALGPVITKFSGAETHLSFIISSLLVFTSFLAISKIDYGFSKNILSHRISLKEFFKNNPRTFMARFLLDFQTFILLIFTVIYGIKIGLTYEAAGLLITAYMVSGFFDVWVGFALKRIDPYKMMKIGFSLAGIAAVIILAYNKSYNLLVALYFIFGLGIACIYVSVFKIANEDYERGRLIAVNTTFQIIGTIGSICGAIIAGFLISKIGASGLPLSIIFANIFYLVFLQFYKKKS